MKALRLVGAGLALASCSDRYAPLSDAQVAIALRAQQDMDTPDRVDADRLERMGRLWVAALAAFASVTP